MYKYPNNKAQSYIIVGIAIMGLGAIKGLYNGLKRTNKRNINDGGPSLNYHDDLISTIGSSGVIVSASTLLGAFEGSMVGFLWPLNLPWGVYQYIKNNVSHNEDESSEDESSEEQEIIINKITELDNNKVNHSDNDDNDVDVDNDNNVDIDNNIVNDDVVVIDSTHNQN